MPLQMTVIVSSKKKNMMPPLMAPRLTWVYTLKLINHINSTHVHGMFLVHGWCGNFYHPPINGTVTTFPSNKVGLACVESKMTSFLSIQVTVDDFLEMCISHSTCPWDNLEIIFLSFSHVGIPMRFERTLLMAYMPIVANSSNKSTNVKKLSMTITWPHLENGPTFPPCCDSSFLDLLCVEPTLFTPW